MPKWVVLSDFPCVGEERILRTAQRNFTCFNHSGLDGRAALLFGRNTSAWDSRGRDCTLVSSTLAWLVDWWAIRTQVLFRRCS